MPQILLSKFNPVLSQHIKLLLEASLVPMVINNTDPVYYSEELNNTYALMGVTHELWATCYVQHFSLNHLSSPAGDLMRAPLPPRHHHHL